MFNVSIREYFSILNMFIVCIRNTAVFKLIPLLCTHVYSYMFSTVHPRATTTISLLRKSGNLATLLPGMKARIVHEQKRSWSDVVTFHQFNLNLVLLLEVVRTQRAREVQEESTFPWIMLNVMTLYIGTTPVTPITVAHYQFDMQR